MKMYWFNINAFENSVRLYLFLFLCFIVIGCADTYEKHVEKSLSNEKSETSVTDDSATVVDKDDSISGNHIYSEYHRGTLLRKWEETGMNGGLASIWEEHYNKNGELEKRVEFEYSSGTTYHETHIIKKTEEFHPNGKIKSRQFKESFMMGEECDCGLWEYFDESGKLTKKDQKRGNCEDLELDCI